MPVVEQLRPSAPPRRRSRLRWLIALGVLLGLLAVADRVGEQVAERVLAAQAESELDTRPQVEIGGFPFLTQAVRGSYDRLRLTAPALDRAGVPVDDFTATLSDAQVPLGQALRREVTEVPVRSLQVSGVVPYDALAQLSGRSGLRLAADPGGVRITDTVRVLGRSVQASAVAAMEVRGRSVVLTATEVQVDGVAPTGALGRALDGALDLSLQVPPLPYGVKLTSVEPGPTGVVVRGSEQDAVLRR